MICYEENYGEDIDGNRGVLRIEYELEDGDKEEIVEKLVERIIEDDYIPKTIKMYCYLIDDDIEIEIDFWEYEEEVKNRLIEELKDEDEECLNDLLETIETYTRR